MHNDDAFTREQKKTKSNTHTHSLRRVNGTARRRRSSSSNSSNSSNSSSNSSSSSSTETKEENRRASCAMTWQNTWYLVLLRCIQRGIGEHDRKRDTRVGEEFLGTGTGTSSTSGLVCLANKNCM
jgi:hypothetical protein